MNNFQLQYLTQDLSDFSHAELAEDACKGGVKWLQLRVKNKDFATWVAIAKQVKAICQRYEVTFIVNDNVYVALAAAADGVHLGKSDMHPFQARNILGNKAIIGGTANNREDIVRLAAAKVDYIGLGPFRFTQTKKKLSPILGEKGYKNIIQHIRPHIQTPLIAIGGIQLSDIDLIQAIGLQGVAISSAINLQKDRSTSAQEWVKACKK
jgi:thiamine-phosphate pyrophosphorylase